MWRSHLKLWIPCLCFYAFISFISSIPGSYFSDIDSPFIYFDKLVHFVLYAFLGMVFARALAWEEYYQHFRKRWYFYFAIILPLISLIDEAHQYFVPDRHMEYSDWFVDIVGAIFGACFYMIVVLRSEVVKESSVTTLQQRDVRGVGLILAMSYFVVLISFNIFDYKRGVLKNYSHLAFAFILLEYGLLGLLTIRFFYLKRDKKFFLLRDWLGIILFGISFIGLYQVILLFLKAEFLKIQEVFWSLFSVLLGATGYYFDKQIERFRKKIIRDPLYKRKTWQRVYFFLPPLFIMGIISFLSAQSPQVLYENQIPLPSKVLPAKGILSVFTNYFVLHGIQFFTLGLFYFRAINWEGWWHKKRQRIWLWLAAIVFMILYACFDEIQQHYTPGRVGDVYDVLTNIGGMSLALLIYLFVYRKVKDRYFSEEEILNRVFS